MRKTFMMLVALALGAALSAAPGTSAHAESVWSSRSGTAVPVSTTGTPDRWVPERTQRTRLVGACYVNTICFYDTSLSLSPFFNKEDVDAPRNQCFNLAPYTSYIKNTSGYVWVVSDHADCSGARANVYAHSEGAMNSFWNNNIRGVFRTSTTG